jgi:damage-control phosphatase, subfamily I
MQEGKVTVLNFKCTECTKNKADYLLEMFEKDEENRMLLREEVRKIVGASPIYETSPNLNARVMRFLKARLELGDIYYGIKKEYNKFLLTLEEEILSKIYKSEDRLLTALKYAMTGNFIDFGAMNAVDKDELSRLINDSPAQPIDQKHYEEFKEDLERAKKIVYLADNAGEIVFDKVFIKVIKETYPTSSITVVVRGMPIHNDATMADAEETGITAMVNVIANGTDIPGTELGKVSNETREAVENADLIISKGQGNFETLFGSGMNIYYIFLCKCSLFAERFKAARFDGIFVNERNVKEMID